jgi:hypothetical protein
MSAGNSTRARYEFALAAAHRQLFNASQRADEMHDEGAGDDLAQLLREVSRLADASLRDKPLRKRGIAGDAVRIPIPMKGQERLPV